MQFTVKLLQILQAQSGQGKNGTWKKQDIIVETDGQYPKKVCVSIWGDKAHPSVLVPGAMLNISFDVESREFNGKWYTDVKAWKVEPAGGQQMPPPVSYDEQEFNQVSPADSDLPF